MANNVTGGLLNFLVYSGASPGRLTGTLQAGEVSLASVITSARVATIYESKVGGGFNSFNPNSPNFSSLKVLQPGKAYAIQAKQSFEMPNSLPHTDIAFQTQVLSWIAANKPGASPTPTPTPGPGPGPSPTPTPTTRPTIAANAPEDFSARPLRTNALTTGLKFAYAGGANKDLVSGQSGSTYIFEAFSNNQPGQFDYVQYPAGNPHTRAIKNQEVTSWIHFNNLGANFAKNYTDYTIVFIGTHHASDNGGGIFSIFSADNTRRLRYGGGIAETDGAYSTGFLQVQGTANTEAQTLYHEEGFPKNEHVGHIFTKKGNVFTYYKNGVFRESETVTTGTFDLNSIALNTGRALTDENNFADRTQQSIQFFMVFDRVLTETEIFNLYNNPYLIVEDPYNDNLDGYVVKSAQLQRVYHIGNSISDTLQLVKVTDLSKNTRRHYLNVGRQMIPGSPLWYIRQRPTEGFEYQPYDRPPNAIANYNWDILCLQASFQTLYAVEDGTNAQIGDVEIVKQFYTDFLTTSPNCKLYLQTRWPSRAIINASNEFNVQWSKPFTTDATVDIATAGYFQRLLQLTRANFPTKTVLMVPIGEALSALHVKAKAGEVPGITSVMQLYFDDEHLDGLGNYFCSLVAYATFFKVTPVGLPTTGYTLTLGDTGLTAPAGAIPVVQQLVWDVVSAHPNAGIAT